MPQKGQEFLSLIGEVTGDPFMGSYSKRTQSFVSLFVSVEIVISCLVGSCERLSNWLRVARLLMEKRSVVSQRWYRLCF